MSVPIFFCFLISKKLPIETMYNTGIETCSASTVGFHSLHTLLSKFLPIHCARHINMSYIMKESTHQFELHVIIWFLLRRA